MFSILWTILNGLGSGIKTVTESTTARLAIAGKFSSSVIIAAMSHWVYWLAWGIAAVPMAAWFGWGMLDTLANGALPDVAVIPPGLKPYADTVWSNIFWAGVTGYGISTAAGTIGKIIGAFKRG